MEELKITGEGQSELLETPLVTDWEELGGGAGRKGQGPADQERAAGNEKETRRPLARQEPGWRRTF